MFGMIKRHRLLVRDLNSNFLFHINLRLLLFTEAAFFIILILFYFKEFFLRIHDLRLLSYY
ncbi:hypothetical protein BFAG_01239 [Bacteroides fragilis 3_1_12]|uniref:Transmembrane protein n=1 Tax=Bacteroides fragilis 3_1_12 TaxID=457424 RepID=A0ABN0BHX6_BACFG|nr:hypothetical protein BFAG_01239 [Bacteroides fragilis 3_1_12]